MHHSPLFIHLRKKVHIFDRGDEKAKEFYDEITNSIPILFKWTGKVNKTISMSGSFNDWKTKVTLSKWLEQKVFQ